MGSLTTKDGAFFAGDVGIGTDSPEAKLHVSTAGTFGLLVDSSGNFGAAFGAQATGLSRAGIFRILNSNSNVPALEVTTTGGFSALDVRTTGRGPAGLFGIDNPNGIAEALGVQTNGNRAAIYALQRGNSVAGVMQIDNTASGFSALTATTNGSGWAGSFEGTRSSSKGVYISTQGAPALQVVGGSKSAVVATSKGARALYTEESSEVWFTDYGFGHLQSGVALIQIDPMFAQTVNLKEPYHVFIQINDPDCEGAAVVNKTDSSFEVRELRGGHANAEFSYRLVAKRRGFEQSRLDHAPWADDDPNLYPEKRAEWEAKHQLAKPQWAKP